MRMDKRVLKRWPYAVCRSGLDWRLNLMRMEKRVLKRWPYAVCGSGLDWRLNLNSDGVEEAEVVYRARKYCDSLIPVVIVC